MGKIVQVKCPFCKKSLRLPKSWLNQPMRCKFCQKVFQAKSKSAPQPGIAVKSSPVPASQPVGVGGKKRGRFPLVFFGLAAMMFVGVVVAASILVAGPHLRHLSNYVSAKIKTKGQPSIDAKEPGKKSPGAQKNGKKKTDTKAKTSVAPKDKSKNAKKTLPNKKKNTPPQTKKKKSVRPPARGKFPRRALAISVNDYLLANPLNYGKNFEGSFPGASTRGVLKWFGHFRMKFPNTQLTELSDYSLDADAPLKPVIENTIKAFLNSSRPQDRIVLLFTGHAVDDGEQGHLVPIEGDLEDPKTLIPISWVYKQLEACPARQKIFIIDVCRYAPSRGVERDGSEMMGESLEQQLKNPPAGVQVWSSCSKEQYSYEFENGSLFLEALCYGMWKRLDGFQNQVDAIPIDQLLPRVNEYLKTRLRNPEWKQTSFVAGNEAAGGADYDPSEPLPETLDVARYEPAGGTAGRAVIKSILDEINSAPPPRSNRSANFGKLRFTALPPFASKILEEYKTDGYTNELEFLKKGEEFPLRFAIVQAKKSLQENANTFRMKERFDGNNSDAVKKQVLVELKKPAECLLKVQLAEEALVEAENGMDKESSKRWKAHFYYVMARLKSRWLYVLEYQEVLAKIRTDDLPPLENGAKGLRIASQSRFTSREGESRVKRKEVKKLWKKIIDNYPETPWAILARRERNTYLGLEWRATRD